MAHTILFTGHMIDAPGRKQPRFPAAKESAVTEAIRKMLATEKQKIKLPVTGIAGGACGGDIIFHELCHQLGIPSTVFLAMPPALISRYSVSFAGKLWEQRFEAILQLLPARELSNDKSGDDPGVWAEANEWMLHEALSNGGANMTLIALWDGKKGDGNGGTEHMIHIAKEHNARVEVLDINNL